MNKREIQRTNENSHFGAGFRSFGLDCHGRLFCQKSIAFVLDNHCPEILNRSGEKI